MGSSKRAPPACTSAPAGSKQGRPLLQRAAGHKPRSAQRALHGADLQQSARAYALRVPTRKGQRAAHKHSLCLHVHGNQLQRRHAAAAAAAAALGLQGGRVRIRAGRGCTWVRGRHGVHRALAGGTNCCVRQLRQMQLCEAGSGKPPPPLARLSFLATSPSLHSKLTPHLHRL